MCYTERKLPAVKQIADRPGLVFAFEHEVDLAGDFFRAAGLVLFQRLVELTVAVDRVMKQRDRLMQLSRRKIGQHLLKTAEGDRALVKIAVGFRSFEADAVGVFIAAPEFAVCVDIIICTVVGLLEVQNLALILHAVAQVFGDRADVFHHGLRVAEDIFIDALQDVDLAAVSFYLIGAVDMPGAVLLAGDRAALQRKMRQDTLRMQLLFQ